MHSFSDNNLMEKVRDGELTRLGILFERYHKKLFNFFFRMTGERSQSEDLVQDVFFRVLKYRETFKGTAPFAMWLFRIAHNAANDHFRGNKETVPVDEQSEHGVEPEAAFTLEKEWDLRVLREALKRLSFEQREVLVLSRFEEMKYEQIAAVTGCSVSAIKVRVHRALKELRAKFFGVAKELAS